jgi:hypothetical protein
VLKSSKCRSAEVMKDRVPKDNFPSGHESSNLNITSGELSTVDLIQWKDSISIIDEVVK